MEMVVAHFPRCGIVFVLRAVLYMFVRYLMGSGLWCFRCLMFMPSGLVELLFGLFEIVYRTGVLVSNICLVERFLILLPVGLLILSVL